MHTPKGSLEFTKAAIAGDSISSLSLKGQLSAFDTQAESSLNSQESALKETLCTLSSLWWTLQAQPELTCLLPSAPPDQKGQFLHFENQLSGLLADLMDHNTTSLVMTILKR